MAGARGRTRRGAAGRLGAGGGARRPRRHPRAPGRRAACPSWCRSATGAWRRRRSRSSAARRRSWPPTSPARRARACTAQLCGDAHLVELRRLRVARSAPGLRPQRLRRDAARPVGVGRQAPRGERRDRRPRPRARRGASATAAIARASRAYRRRCASSPSMRNLEIWYARLDADASWRRWGAPLERGRPATFERGLAKARDQGQPPRARKLTQRGRRRAAHRQRPAAARAGRRAAARDRAATVVADAVARPAARATPRRLRGDRRTSARELPVRRPGAQGRRRRQRRDPRLGRAAARRATTRTRWCCSSRRRGRRCWSRTPARGRVRQPRAAGRRGAAADAGRERHLPRLGPRPRRLDGASATSTCASCGTGSSADGRAMRPAGLTRLRPRCAAGRSRAPMRAPATGSRSRPTSARGDGSTVRWRASPRPTPTRTSATTRAAPGDPQRPRARRARRLRDAHAAGT